jgi:hypothetical protein
VLSVEKERPARLKAQRAKFREETPVTRQVEETFLFLAVMMRGLSLRVQQKTHLNRTKIGLSDQT